MNSTGSARTFERALFVGFCLLLLSLHVALFRHSGSFWRDEASSIQVATSDGLRGVWRTLWAVSYPALFVGVLRIWILAGPGASAAGLRLLGMTISLGAVVAMVLGFRSLTRGLPLVALALIALNASVFYFGSSLRAYGLSVLLIVPCFAAFWRLVRSPTQSAALAAMALALLTVHCNYQNACVVFGLCLGGGSACVHRRLWKRVILVVAIGAVAGLSMLVYLPIVRRFHEVSMIPAVAPDTRMLAANFAAALAGGNRLLLAFWMILLLAVPVLLGYRYRREDRNAFQGARAPSLSLFAVVALATAAASGAIFFRASRMFPYAWHCAPFVALAAATVQVALDFPWSETRRVGVNAALACAVASVSVGPVWHAARVRRTNLDLVAALLERNAEPDDLILVTSVWLSPGFNYHYRGKTQWNILPMVATDRESRLEVGGQVERLMSVPQPLAPTLAVVEATLRGGHRVWSVGGPDPNPVWLMEYGRFLKDHASRGRRIPIHVDQPVSALEDASLFFVEGWRG